MLRIKGSTGARWSILDFLKKPSLIVIEGDIFSYVPVPNYTNFQQKITKKSFKNDFLDFCVKVSY